jgi:hypothetical protein
LEHQAELDFLHREARRLSLFYETFIRVAAAYLSGNCREFCLERLTELIA